MEENKSHFWDNYNRICLAKGKAPSSVVRAIGISPSVISHWKSGGRPRFSTAQKIAKYLGISESELFAGDEDVIIQDDVLIHRDEDDDSPEPMVKTVSFSPIESELDTGTYHGGIRSFTFDKFGSPTTLNLQIPKAMLDAELAKFELDRELLTKEERELIRAFRSLSRDMQLREIGRLQALAEVASDIEVTVKKIDAVSKPEPVGKK